MNKIILIWKIDDERGTKSSVGFWFDSCKLFVNISQVHAIVSALRSEIGLQFIRPSP